MISKEVEITFRVKPEQAAALLEFLSCVLRADIMRALNSPEQIQAFDFASERLRVALRKVVEPDVEPDEEPDEEPDVEPDEEPDNNDTWKRTPPRRSGNSEFPPKPPRMRWTTYQQLLDQHDELQNRWTAGVMARFGAWRS